MIEREGSKVTAIEFHEQGDVRADLAILSSALHRQWGLPTCKLDGTDSGYGDGIPCDTISLDILDCLRDRLSSRAGVCSGTSMNVE